MPAFYRASVSDFLNADPATVIGQLHLQSRHAVSNMRTATVVSWERTVTALRDALREVAAGIPTARRWGLLLEYEIPRRNCRIDCVLLAGQLVIILELKTGATGSASAAKRQVEHYAIELRDFHAESRNRRIVPVAVLSGSTLFQLQLDPDEADLVQPVQITGDVTLSRTLLAVAHVHEAAIRGGQIDLAAWDESAYAPIPNIVEAAQMLFAGQSVREISHAHTDAYNLTKTTDVLVDAVQRAQRERRKAVCFVTGVPGAGKTLAGLNVVHSPDLLRDGRPVGAFLSGNGPLVKVLIEALAQDHHRRTRETLAESRRRARTFIQSVHGFLKAYRAPGRPPPERVVVFDEAQRAWDAEKVRKELLRRATSEERNHLGPALSEPALMLSIMDRWPDWAVIIALVGGGQEIHDGEAGLAEWGRALRERFPHWEVVASPEALEGGPSVAGSRLFPDGEAGSLSVRQERYLHLPVAVRSFRAQAVAEWVNAVVNGHTEQAAQIAAQVSSFPIKLTRSLDEARRWLKQKTRGYRRCGLLASSGALRLRAHGLEVSSGFRSSFPFQEWFLAEPDDVRSSNWLEVALTEFECQGLELDWVGVCWGGDFTWGGNTWEFRQFRGSTWQSVQKPTTREYIRNKYRVLLTRAREGLVIWVPEGSVEDETRPPEWFDSTAEFLRQCGATDL
ncbi:MAG: DUF2075 domain-containing protein [Limisphaera sp.]